MGRERCRPVGDANAALSALDQAERVRSNEVP
jgi:hypothetical protein